MNPTLIFKVIKNSAALAGIAMLTACAATSHMASQTNSPLPIKALGGQLSGTRSFETQNRLYVSGTVKKTLGSDVPHTAHVDVRLLDSSGIIVAETRGRIISGATRKRRGIYSFATSFPLSQARQASKVVVAYHPKRHLHEPLTNSTPGRKPPLQSSNPGHPQSESKQTQ